MILDHTQPAANSFWSAGLAITILATGTVQRCRLTTGSYGRFLEFHLVNGPRRLRCRFPVVGQLGEALAHGRRYAVLGSWARLEGRVSLLVRYHFILGQAECCSRSSVDFYSRVRRKRHRALMRQGGRAGA